MTERTHAVLIKPGKRETESMLIEADGLSAMVNHDSSISFELYTDNARANRLLVRLSPADTKSQAHVFKRWGAQ